MIRHVMQVLGGSGVKTFRLGSVPTAIGVYKKVGFQAEFFTSAQETALPINVVTDAFMLDAHVTIEQMTLDDLNNGVVRIDEMYFKSDRSQLLKELFQDSVRESCLCLKDRGRMVGYLMIRRRTLSKDEGGFIEGPDLAYRLGPSCVLPEYGLDGFKALFNRAIRPVNAEVEQSGMSARMYVVFPQNADRERLYTDFEALGGDRPEAVFNEHDHIFGAEPLAKNEALWSWMKQLGFVQEYFEQTMSVTIGENPGSSLKNREARHTLADAEGIFASATPGDKA